MHSSSNCRDLFPDFDLFSSTTICLTLPGYCAQAEVKQNNGSVFRRNLLNRLQQEFKNREEMRKCSIQEWVCFVTFICNIFDYLKVTRLSFLNTTSLVWLRLFLLSIPDSFILFWLLLGEQYANVGSGPSCVWLFDNAKSAWCPDEWRGSKNLDLLPTHHIEESCLCSRHRYHTDLLPVPLQVDCLVLQLHRIGEQLENANRTRMDEIFFLIRDGFLLQEGVSSLSRLLLLEILEFRAGGWSLSATADKYYYSEITE